MFQRNRAVAANGRKVRTDDWADKMLRDARMIDVKGGFRTFAAAGTNVSEADKVGLRRARIDGRF